MNLDLDNRILPNGEYRQANNLQISRSEGAEVGEFENVLRNEEIAYLYTGSRVLSTGIRYEGKIIGQFTDETTENIYIFSASYGNLGQLGRCPRDIKVFTDPALVTDRYGSLVLYDEFGNVLDPTQLGLAINMSAWGDNWNGQASGAGGQGYDPVIEAIIPPTFFPPDPDTDGRINLSNTPPFFSASNEINFGYTNTIHRYNPTTNIVTLLARGSFLNFNSNFKIYGINLIDDLLFWTDNRNQPRKINVNLANPNSLSTPVHYVNEDQISVAKYYPYETPLVLQQDLVRGSDGIISPADWNVKGYQLEIKDLYQFNIKIGDIVSGFPDQLDDEIWQVLFIEPSGGNDQIVIYNNFLTSPGTWNGVDVIDLKFSRSSAQDQADRLLTRGFDTEYNFITSGAAPATFLQGDDIYFNYFYTSTIIDPSNNPTPQIGDFIISKTMSNSAGTVGITLADQVCIQEVGEIVTGGGGRIKLKLTQEITVNDDTDDISISANPNYGLGQTPAEEFTGDPDLIEEKFVRFSYRFKFEDNEYSLSAPFTQICFIPEQQGIFGNGPNNQTQDMINAYDSTILEWFINSIDTINLKIPLPDSATQTTAIEAVDSLIDGYKVTDIEILYKESNATTIKILEVIPVNVGLATFVEEIPSPAAPTGPQWYYNFDYKSIKPYRTLPTNQQNRVYDNVPLKALGQEVSGSRVIYGNFLQQHTPPVSLDYEAINADKSIAYDNYAQYPNHSLKQNRNYQAGFVLSDRYGRASSVVLSSNDSIPTAQGSTLYTPYKSFSDVDNIDETTYKWLGNALRIKINNGLTPSQQTNNETTGEPGLYKSNDDTSIDQLEITNGGGGYVVGDIITLRYEVGRVGLGINGEIEVTGISAGVVTGVQIINRGEGYNNGAALIQSTTTGIGAGFECTAEVYPANPTGWQSYKIVVKQQEQEYYNVYLPGYVSGYPVLGGGPTFYTRDYGRVAFAALLGDNINKVPRDLNEVGPTQSEFSASVKLFGRVNNPNINNNQKPAVNDFYYNNRAYAWNTQYFPDRANDEAVTIGPIGSGGLELANSPFTPNASQGAFDNFPSMGPPAYSAAIPWGSAGELQSFYNVEQNPLAIGLAVGAEKSQPYLTQPLNPNLNTLGAQVSGETVPAPVNRIGCMIPFLSVSETEPVESLLEIFYESSTSGNFIDLNRSVVADYGGVVGTTLATGSFDESDSVGQVVATGFSFVDSAGNELTLDSVPLITSIIDGNGSLSPGTFTVESVGGGASLIDFDLKTNDLFAYLKPSGTHSNQFIISFQTSYNSGEFIDNLPNQITITLDNDPPTIQGFTPSYGDDIGIEQACGGNSIGYTTLDTGVFGQFTNVLNGSADLTQNTLELCYSLILTAEPVGSTALFSIDQTGIVTLDSGTTVNGTYEFTCTVIDASPSCSNDINSKSVDCVYSVTLGTPPVNRVLCYGPTIEMDNLDTSCGPSFTAIGRPLEVFFGASEFVNSSIVGLAGPFVGSGTITPFTTIDAALGVLGPKYGFTANFNGLAYYNVLFEGRDSLTSPIQCGGSTELFTTGALTQGILQIVPTLTKTATVASPSTYETNFTILYRATAADIWVIASCDVSSPAQPLGGTVSNFEQLSVSGAAGVSQEKAYNFSTPGEYVVRNNGVYSIGCTGCELCASFTVQYYDALTGSTGNCVTCLGPL